MWVIECFRFLEGNAQGFAGTTEAELGALAQYGGDEKLGLRDWRADLHRGFSRLGVHRGMLNVEADAAGGSSWRLALVVWSGPSLARGLRAGQRWCFPGWTGSALGSCGSGCWAEALLQLGKIDFDGGNSSGGPLAWLLDSWLCSLSWRPFGFVFLSFPVLLLVTGGTPLPWGCGRSLWATALSGALHFASLSRPLLPALRKLWSHILLLGLDERKAALRDLQRGLIVNCGGRDYAQSLARRMGL